jgi:hypothetical protein
LRDSPSLSIGTRTRYNLQYKTNSLHILYSATLYTLHEDPRSSVAVIVGMKEMKESAKAYPH